MENVLHSILVLALFEYCNYTIAIRKMFYVLWSQFALPLFQIRGKSPGAALCTQFARSTVGVSVNEQLKQGPRPRM